MPTARQLVVGLSAMAIIAVVAFAGAVYGLVTPNPKVAYLCGASAAVLLTFLYKCFSRG